MSKVDSPPGDLEDKGPSPQPFVSLSREVDIRHRILSIYNKEEEDFDDKKDYDDYLEEREDIMFNLAQGLDVKEMEAKIKKYKEEHAESIAKNEARRLQRMLATGGQYEDRMAVEGEVHDEENGGLQLNIDDRVVHMMSEEEVNGVLRKQTKEEWERMAVCSGWSRSFFEKQCQALYAT